jgi:hypothetical protein
MTMIIEYTALGQHTCAICAYIFKKVGFNFLLFLNLNRNQTEKIDTMYYKKYVFTTYLQNV